MKIKNIKLYLLSICLTCSFASCLDKYPEDAMRMEEAINTPEDVNQLVIGIYSAFKSPALYSGYLTLLPDIQTDLVYGVIGNTNIYGDIWRWKDIQSTNTEIEKVYGALYNVINQANFLLDNVERVRNNALSTENPDEALDKLDQYCGEAYFARALAYSELIKLFCKSYESDEEAANELGVVLTLHYKGDEPMKRASLKDSYALVLSDLDKAADLLKLEEDYNPATHGALFNTTYFNEYTVHALRARVALYMRKWDDAIKYASKVIDSNYYVLSSVNQYVSNGVNYYKYMWTSDNSTEAIWKVGFTINSYGGALGTVFSNYDFVSFKPDYVPANWVFDLYANDDLRAPAIFKTMLTGYSHALQWPLLIKYFGNETFQQYNVFHVSMPKVFRLSEQYLIRAEAYVQKEKFNEAGNDITTLRTARYETYGGGTSMSKQNAMEVIEQERVKELYMEGFRLQDLKRWHKGFERKPQEQTLDTGNRLKVEKDDPLFVWPIPQHELEAPGSEIEPNESNK